MIFLHHWDGVFGHRAQCSVCPRVSVLLWSVPMTSGSVLTEHSAGTHYCLLVLWIPAVFERRFSFCLPSFLCLLFPSSCTCFFFVYSLSLSISLQELCISLLHDYIPGLNWVLSFTSPTLNQYWLNQYRLFFNYTLNAVIWISISSWVSFT